MSSEQENPAKRVVSRPIIKRRLQPRSSVGASPIAKPTHPNIKERVRPRTAAAPPKKRGELPHGPSATHELDKKNVNASLLAHRREFLAISDDDYEQLEEELGLVILTKLLVLESELEIYYTLKVIIFEIGFLNLLSTLM